LTGKKTFYFNALSERDTVRLAEHLAAMAGPGAILGLDGDLGAGKTRFSQAMGKALGVTEVVNSPTFTIIKEYMGEQLPFYHMDVYRVSLPEAEELGLDEYFYGEGVTLVEWSSRIAEIMPEDRLSVYIENLGGDERNFILQPFGQPYLNWCTKLQEMGVVR
jgi:tRNA threonylcarbamoyladenosine biosynthesis protein TsaE